MSTRRVESFVLRLVVNEGQALATPNWRGRIQHIASGQELQIDEIDDAVAFISAYLRRTDELPLIEGEPL